MSDINIAKASEVFTNATQGNREIKEQVYAKAYEKIDNNIHFKENYLDYEIELTEAEKTDVLNKIQALQDAKNIDLISQEPGF